jgi:tripartite-type tricarboxylate transporter receptor subunit TctC
MMLRRSALALLGLAWAGPTLADDYPSRPISLIVPFAAGGPTDLMARIVGERMGKELGQQIVIDNVTGAAGTIAMGKLAHAAPDGYTIGIGHLGTNVVNGLIYKNLNFDLLNDLVPIARLPANPLLVVTSNQVPAKTLKELVAYLKANGDKVSGGTAGLGSGSHIGFLAFQAGTGTNYQLVPYRGTGPAMQDLIANQIQIIIDQSSNSLPQVRAGKIRAYAVTAKERTAAAPDLPTTAEAGFPGIEVTIWHGLWAPKGTPSDIIAKLNAAAVATLKDPEIRRRLEDLGQDIPTPEQMQPASFAAFQRAEFAKWKPIIEKANVKVE